MELEELLCHQIAATECLLPLTELALELPQAALEALPLEVVLEALWSLEIMDTKAIMKAVTTMEQLPLEQPLEVQPLAEQPLAEPQQVEQPLEAQQLEEQPQVEPLLEIQIQLLAEHPQAGQPLAKQLNPELILLPLHLEAQLREALQLVVLQLEAQLLAVTLELTSPCPI